MANNIATAEQLKAALRILKRESIPIRVNIAFPNTLFSFEGDFIDADSDTIQIAKVRDGEQLALFRISPLDVFDFVGGFLETETGIAFSVSIVRKGKFNSFEIPRTHRSADWTRATDSSGLVH